MRIATYNVWNENKGWGERFLLLKNEILRIDADIIVLQEVTPRFWKEILTQIGYEYSIYGQYPWEEEGLAILSRFPINKYESLYTNKEYGSCIALNTLIEVNGINYSVTNVHLPWDSVLKREKQIVSIDSYIHKSIADFYVLLGDFNCGYSSSVHRFLLGDQTLDGIESAPCWNELSTAYAARFNQNVEATLDPVNNPRWTGKMAPFAPMVMDRIYIMESWNSIALHNVETFGKSVSKKIGLAPSDHYGVVADISFTK